MPGFLSAIFAAPDAAHDATASADQASVAGALDPSIHLHIGESGPAEHADGSVTDWSNAQDLDAHLDIHAVTQFALDQGHTDGIG